MSGARPIRIATFTSDTESVRSETKLDFFHEPGLLDWPHEQNADCICDDSSLQFMDFHDFYERFLHRTDMNETEMRDYHSRLWEHTWWGPTLYAYEYHKPGRAGLIYAKCRPSELKDMLASRGLSDPYPAGLTLSCFYVQLLKKDDRNSTFRLMDLPPELRINVCRLLFSTGCSKPKDVAILRTCRQVYEEAKDLPYSEPTILVQYKIQTWNGFRYDRTLNVHEDFQRLSVPHGRFYCLPRSIDDYPEYMRRIHRLKIHLSHQDGFLEPNVAVGRDWWSEFNQVLLGLSSFLMEGHQLKNLIIHLQFPECVEDAALEKCVYPLRRIRNVPNITFEGTIPAHVMRKLKSDMSSCEPVFNTLRQWRLLQEEACAQIDLLEEMSCFGCDCGECPPGERAEQIMFRLQSLNEVKQLCCTSSAHEENFLARLGMLKMTLQLVDIIELRRHVRAIAEKRKAVTRYDQTTDDERLNEAIKLWGMDIYKSETIAARDNHDWSEDEEEEAEVDEQGVSANPNH